MTYCRHPLADRLLPWLLALVVVALGVGLGWLLWDSG